MPFFEDSLFMRFFFIAEMKKIFDELDFGREKIKRKIRTNTNGNEHSKTDDWKYP